MKLFCDGIFDVFHYGHVNHFKKIKKLYPESYLIVGILNDEESAKYKRKPIFDQNKRKELVESCKYVDQTTFDYPIIMSEKYINDNKIDLVIHAFCDETDFEKQRIFFDIPIKLNKFLKIDYDKSISSTSIINNLKKLDKIDNTKYRNKIGWDFIWEKKGDVEDNNLFELNGYDSTDFNHEICFNEIIKLLNIPPNSRVLEIGCGAGLFSKLFCKEYDYFGIDYSSTLINKNINLVNSKVYNCEAKDLPFKDKYFDYVFSVGVFEYFPSKDYMKDVIKEIKRVTKHGVCILNIRNNTHQTKKKKHIIEGTFKHLIYSPEDFKDFNVLEANYEKNDRFSVYKFL
tara:strand:- start:7460 stop:8488 length:1029 start_codon:yes stop_codon:yes gene_type:complete